MSAVAESRTDAAPPRRIVEVDIADTDRLSLGEVGELCELAQLDALGALEHLDRQPPHRIIAVALALAVVITRRTEPEASMADARTWDVRLVRRTPSPNRRARATGRARTGR